MPTSENEKEFFRALTNPRHNPKADCNLDRYLDILRRFEADKTDEELDALTDAEYEAITGELCRQAGLTESDRGELLEAWMDRGDVKVRTID
jgi:hypothetical protein